MRSLLNRCVLIGTVLAGGLPCVGEELSEIQCIKSVAFLAPADASGHRNYAPDRKIDILHLALEVTPDFGTRTVTVKTVLRFQPIAIPLRELTLDAVDLDFSSVTATQPIQAHQVTGQKLIVTFAADLPAGKEVSLTTIHKAEPSKGLYFRTPEMGYKKGETHLFTQGEAIEARHWYPCFDAPNEKFTSEITCRVPEAMTVISNGRLMSETRESGSGLKAVQWLQDKPHVNYLISLVAGNFKKIEDRYGDIEMAFYTLPSAISEAANSFRNTRDVMGFFEREIGVPYPWHKYDQICVNDFVAGGMENTSATTLTDNTLFTEASETLRSSDGLVAHELAHQWFGDLVTCKDWSHLWLNEGFATFYAHLYDGFHNGRDSMLYGLYRDARGILGRTNDTVPIVTRTFESPDSQFSFRAYQKGSWVLHMLRSQLGESLYRNCVRTYLEQHAYGNVETADLNSVIESLSGRSFDQFFDQWVYHAHHPELEVTYAWDEKAGLAKVSVTQTQKTSNEVLLFNLPLKVRFKLASGNVDREIRVSAQSEDFHFPLPSAPVGMRFDPDYTVLAKIKLQIPDALLESQLADESDVVGRLLAIEQLSGKRDAASVSRLAKSLQNDPFYGVRLEAARALRAIHSDAAFDALADSLDQDDARVRAEVVSGIGGFYREAAFEKTLAILKTEKNPEILARALDGLAAYSKPVTRETLLRFLNTDSYRERLAGAAIRAMREQDDPDFTTPLMKAIRDRGEALPTSTLGQALAAVAHLARNAEDKSEASELIAGFTANPRENLRLAAIRALGTLGDSTTIPALETFASAGKQSPDQKAAEDAIRAIRATRRPIDDLKQLRNEVLDLQKENRDLKNEFDALKKKLEAGTPASNNKRERRKKSP
jgi:aminopeptidase N